MGSSIFGQILRDIVVTLPGALGAILIDWEGEAVDEFSCIGTAKLRLVGAHWGIAYCQASSLLANQGLGPPGELILGFKKQQIIIRPITKDYLVLIVLQQEANLGRARHRLKEAVARLQEQM